MRRKFISFVWFLFFILLWVPSVHSDVTIHNAAATGSAAATTVTISSYAVTAGAQFMVVGACDRGNIAVSSVTWNTSENLIFLAGQNGGTGIRTEMWVLTNPTAVTANLVVTWASGAARRTVGVRTFKGVNTSSPYGTAVTGTPTGICSVSEVISVAVTDATTGGLVVDALCLGDGDSPSDATIGAGQTEAYTVLIGTTDFVRGKGSSEPGAVGTVTMSWTGSVDAAYCSMAAVALQPARSRGGPMFLSWVRGLYEILISIDLSALAGVY